MTDDGVTSHTPGVGVGDAVRRVYGDREPDVRWNTELLWADGGPDPLDAILIYARDEPVPHWHYVGVGLTAPSSKVVDGEAVDDGRGWSFELTARLARTVSDPDGGHAHPPAFMVNVLQNLARYVATSGVAFGPGHTTNLNGPIQAGATTPVGHVLFVEDPELRFADRSDPATSSAAVDFLQLVGLTADEAVAKKSWTAAGFGELFAQHYPLLVTRLDRTSILTDPATRAALESGRARDGSSTASLAVDRLEAHWSGGVLQRLRRQPRELVVTIGADVVETFCLLLPLRLGVDRPLELTSPRTRVTFSSDGDVAPHRHGRGDWCVGLSPDQVSTLTGALAPRSGTYRVDVLPGLVFEVQPTVIRDASGDAIATIG